METDLLIVTVTKVETTSVFEVFRAATGKDANPIPIGDKTYHDLGTVNGTRTCLVQSEMGAGGLGSALQTVQKGIEALTPDAVVMVGIAFGVNDKKQAIGDILVARQLIPYDFQKVSTKKSGEGVIDNVILRDDRPHCSLWLFDTFRSAELYWKGQTVHVGSVLTGEKLIDNLEFRNELLELAPEAIGGEMEGRGLYVACQDKKVDWILVKAISDWGDGHKSRNKKKYQELAGRNAAEFVLHVLQKVGLRKGTPQIKEAIQSPSIQVQPNESRKKPTLRFTQNLEGEDHYRVDISIDDDDGSHQSTPVNFEFKFDDSDRADIRWYLEDYLQYPLDPAPKIAERVEKRMSELGNDLFNLLFKSTQASRLWAKIEDKLDDTRVEIVTDVKGAVALPWELLRDPQTDSTIALRANSFVRAHYSAARKAERAQATDKVRILLVICRPGGREDVPFRSVASRLLKGLSEEARERFELEVLRPPTFEQLGKVLRDAKAKGKPYHIVHFDGHGAYLESAKDALERIMEHLGMLVFGSPREGTHGYLIFENSKAEQNGELIDGPSLGNLLVETDVPVLILNACRSAHADIQEKPIETDDVNAQVRAFGSLAQEVMDAGVAGVVAMRYNVYVVTAAQFVADLYAALASGQGLGEAVSMGRKQLAAQPLREIAFDPIPLQDWSVPVAYEAAPIQLFARSESAAPIKIDLSKKISAEDNLPRPDVGFFGRDETILALDRAFDTQSVVLLNAYAGSGKTMTAAEFARWYAQTGGLRGPILFTSFEQYKPFTQILSAVEETYRPVLEQNNIQWLALSDEDRLNLTLQIFKQIPPLWIWDNVEPVNGFPAGADSAWSLSEQRELRTFLQIVTAQSQTKFLLTSRRDEREWLGDIPKRVTLPPMPMQERVRLTRALADKQGKRIADVKDWLPLLRFTQGNPLTITVMVGQALRDGLETSTQVNAYLEKLHNGETAFDDEASEGRSKSLGASLSYGFEQAFNADERKVLALLHFFQGFVNTRVLQVMGLPEMEWHLPELANLKPETFNTLLDKAADIGLLTAHGGGYYTIHPALPWFFKSLFEQYYPADDDRTQTMDDGRWSHSPPSIVALRAFIESMGELGNYYMQQYANGNRDVIAPLRSEEPNLLRARSLARQQGWWDAIISTMQGLRQLYDHTGRRAEWKRLVEEIVPDFVGANDLPLSGREEQWGLVNDYRVRLLEESRDLLSARKLQINKVKWSRDRAKDILGNSIREYASTDKALLRTVAADTHELAGIERELGEPDCVKSYQETFEIMQRIGDVSAAVAAFNLGHAYSTLPALRNLDEAERWYRRSLELRAEGDRKGKGICMGQIGFVAFLRFQDAKSANNPEAELQSHLEDSMTCYQQALNLFPPDDIDDLATTHDALGLVYNLAGIFEKTKEHAQIAINYAEKGENNFLAGRLRYKFAINLAEHALFSDALLYARAALRNFESYGGRAKDQEDRTKGLIEEIEKRMKDER
jgi:nucleoside phosphorylase